MEFGSHVRCTGTVILLLIFFLLIFHRFCRDILGFEDFLRFQYIFISMTAKTVAKCKDF